MSSSTDLPPPDALRREMLELCRVNKVLTRREETALAAYVECLKAHLKHTAMELMREAQGQAVMFAYCADGTPLETRAAWSSTAGGGTVHRRGRVLHELFMQRGS